VTEEARLEESEYGLVAATEGWFVVNIREAAWMTNEYFGDACIFEGGEVGFEDVGYTLGVLQPGRPSGLYHREASQENFLVLAGECVLLIEGEERHLKQWDFVHCPPSTEHILVGAGEAPCVVFMTGARKSWPEKGIVYPSSELAQRHKAGVEEETTNPPEAYAKFPKWQPGQPKTWQGLPWEEAEPERSEGVKEC
jgi:uncharacterized cupin superfamily protein